MYSFAPTFARQRNRHRALATVCKTENMHFEGLLLLNALVSRASFADWVWT